jgi:hypothetical protein
VPARPTFLPEHPITSGPLDLGAFSAYLVEHDLLPADGHLSSIELGSEVVVGTGTVEVSGFSITIQ